MNNIAQIAFNENEPIIATAIHNGDNLSNGFSKICKLTRAERFREEDPFTGELASSVPSSIICQKSRFECDLNRPREKSVYRKPEDAWGLDLWNSPLSESMINNSLVYYDSFYNKLFQLYSKLSEAHGKFVVLDFHSYNYRRAGAEELPSPESTHPTVNIGTGTMNREKWAPLVDRFIEDLRNYQFFGKSLNVQENVIFKGGHHALWTHQNFPDSACVLSIEIKKFFMDEWTGELYRAILEELKNLFCSTISGLTEEINR